MAKKRLEGEALREFEELVLSKKTPEDIAQYFNISVSSVHNYKKSMKERGINIPIVRGKRPQGFAPRLVSPRFVTGTNLDHKQPSPARTGNREYIEFLVNGHPVLIPKNVKRITVENNRAVLEY